MDKKMKRKIIIDCDPGIDDALALMAAFAAPEVEVIAVTSVAGNVSAAYTARNALGLCELAGSSAIVAAGAEGPLEGQAHEASDVHGQNGLGNVELPVYREISGRYAPDFLYDELVYARGDVDLIALGPLTNIAILIEEHPDAVDLIPRLSLMGGSLGRGNITPHAEFNFYADPAAADRVLRSGIPIDMYGLDVTNVAPLYPEQVDELDALGGPVLTPVCEMVRFYQAFYESKGHRGLKMHDPLAVVGSFMPEISEMKTLALGVDCSERETRGKVLVLEDGPATVNVAVKHDQELFITRFMELMKFWAGGPMEDVTGGKG